VIPQLRELEQRYPDTVAIVGVDSGKFTAERVTSRVRDAALRLGNTHPIVNDRQLRIWRAYAVNAWPTLVVVDPDGRVLGSHAGEFTSDVLAPLIDQLIATHTQSGTLSRRALSFAPDEPTIAPGILRYPGKVAVSADRIAIADTGHHRVLVGRLDRDGGRARIERVVGGDAGAADDMTQTLAAPQGVVFDGDTLYVADAERHVVCAVDLSTGVRRTIAGTGHQVRTRADLRAGALSSPWDLALLGDTLYIAMAGVHQLWSLALPGGAPRVHSGSGAEALADGPHGSAVLAQPMGIAAAGTRLVFTDSESSAVRWSDADPAGSVGTIVGTGLFDFGDRDGVGDDVRLQHPQGVAVHQPTGRALVADTYNDALKWVDPRTRRVETWVRGLHEPAGVACGERHAYVADTNAHRIAVVEYDSGEVRELELEE
jgi:DNA-binding beta-propeller fold protein YncE